MKRKQGFNSGTNKPILFLGYLCALVSLVFVRILENGFDLPKFLVAFGGIICLLCYLLILFSKKNFFPIYKNPLYFPLFLFLGWQVFSIFFAVNKIAGISEIGLTLVCSTLVFIIPLILKDASDVILLARIIAISSGIIAIYGIFQHFGFDFFMWTRENSALSTLGRRNFAGEYLVLVIPWALFCFFTSGRQFKVVFILIFVLLLTHLFLTFTRASWIGFISSILLLLLLLIREPIKTTKVIQFVFMLLLLLLVTNVYAGVFQFEKGTVKSRILIWKSCVFVIKHAPFMGVGTGNFEIGYYKYASDNPNAFVPSEVRIDKAHNEFIEIAVENGIIGLTLFLFFIFTIYKMAWLILASRNKKEFEKFVSIFAIASITGILVNSLASFPLQRTIGSFFFFLNCGILSRMYFNMLEVNPVHKKFTFIGIPGFCTIIVFAYILFSACAVISSYNLKKSQVVSLAITDNSDPVLWLYAERHAKDALKFNPFDRETYWNLGAIYMMVNQLGNARKYFLEALKYQPYSITVLMALGRVEQRAGNFDLAEEYFLRALKVSRKDPKILKATAYFYLESKNYEKAISYFLQALEISPEDKQLSLDLGQAYLEKGDAAKAKDTWLNILKKDPNCQKAKEKLNLLR